MTFFVHILNLVGRSLKFKKCKKKGGVIGSNPNLLYYNKCLIIKEKRKIFFF